MRGQFYSGDGRTIPLECGYKRKVRASVNIYDKPTTANAVAAQLQSVELGNHN
jgi:hypothetical protein